MSDQLVICPVCQTPELSDFLSVTGVPVTCTSIFATQVEARNIPCGDIDLCACRRCSFAFNRSFDAKLGEVGARYESSQAASAHFSAFAKSLADDWVSRYGLRSRTIVEVGCGGGDFLRQLIDSGAAYGVGIDPLAPSLDHPRIRTLSESFDPNSHDCEAAALICRHTLEHVADVGNFLRKIRTWAGAAPDRIVLFELPDAERVFSQRAFWDVYYEHCNYFTLGTVRTAFERAGLQILRISRAYNDQYLLVEARAGSPIEESLDPAIDHALSTYRDFAHDVKASVGQCGKSLGQLAANSRVVIWQGAAKTVGLLSFLGDTSAIECAVDLNPERQGRFLPGTGLPVFAPEALRKIRPENIVLMNPVYLDEVRAAVRELQVSAQIHSINDLLRVE